MRFFRRYLIAPAVAAGLIIASMPAAPAEAQQPVTIQLAALNNSGVSGTATLTAMGQQTMVVLSLQNAPGPHPAHIHAGTCTNLTPAPSFPLSPVNAGKSETMVNTPLSDIQKSPMAINVHKSPTEAAIYVACGNIPVVAAAAPAPIAVASPAAVAKPVGAPAPAAAPSQLPRTGETDTSVFGLATLALLLLAAGAGLIIRRRSI